jgi:hypothetical protein
MTRKVFVFVSDTHGASTLGLLNPDTILDRCTYGSNGLEHDYWQPSLSGFQKLLWEQYTKGIKKIKKWSKNDELILVHNGDITDGSKYPDNRIDVKQSSQVRIATNNMIPWFELKNLSTVILIDGTSSHEFGNGSSVELVAGELALHNAKNDGEVRIERRRHALLDADGCLFDVAHHGPGTGSRFHLKGDNLRRYVRDVCIKEVVRGRTLPSVIVRSHFHEYIKEPYTIENHTCWGIITPCFCGMNHYATQATSSGYELSIGMIGIEVIDGEVGQIRPLVETLDLRQEIKV